MIIPCDISFGINCGGFLLPVRRDISPVPRRRAIAGYAWHRAHLSDSVLKLSWTLIPKAKECVVR